jgi:uncharacterized protein YlzI (FlbEa/FlbD family)
MKLIELTDYGSRDKITVFVENISTLKQSPNGTYVSMNSGETDFVRESVPEIIKEIRNHAVNVGQF